MINLLNYRRNFFRKRNNRFKLILVTTILFLLIVEYRTRFNNTVLKAKPINSKCMPIEIQIEAYEKCLEKVDKRKHVKCNEDDWVKVENDGTVKFNTNYLDVKNLNISSKNLN